MPGIVSSDKKSYYKMNNERILAALREMIILDYLKESNLF